MSNRITSQLPINTITINISKAKYTLQLHGTANLPTLMCTTHGLFSYMCLYEKYKHEYWWQIKTKQQQQQNNNNNNKKRTVWKPPCVDNCRPYPPPPPPHPPFYFPTIFPENEKQLQHPHNLWANSNLCLSSPRKGLENNVVWAVLTFLIRSK